MCLVAIQFPALLHILNKESSAFCGAFVPAGYHLISLIILAPEIVRPIKSLLIKTVLH